MLCYFKDNLREDNEDEDNTSVVEFTSNLGNSAKGNVQGGDALKQKTKVRNIIIHREIEYIFLNILDSGSRW